MSKSTLLILAFNEEKNIKKTVNSYLSDFNYVLVVNDSSTDKTSEILENLKQSNSNLIVIKNKKNLGAGYSFQVGLDYISENLKESDVIIKIDGDGQFDRKDVITSKELLETKKIDFVKCNRFWDNGIIGNIPTIRYLGNSMASLLVKFITGQFNLNDPLNGLFGFRYSFIKSIEIPKTFKRYGYPFYLNCTAVSNNLLITEIYNIVKYDVGEKSQLKALPLLIKLIKYSFKYFVTNLSKKLRNSQLQISAIMDLFFLFLQILSISTIYKLIRVRFFDISGSQTNWLVLFVIIQLFSLVVIYISKNLENKYRSNNFLSHIVKS